jgi:hypothetical protein
MNLIAVQVVVNSVDLSAWVDTVDLEEAYADTDTTAFGSGSKTRQAGLGDHKVTLDFQQDWALSAVEATIYPLLGTTVAVAIVPVSGTMSSTNPGYLFSALINSWHPINGKVGDLAKSSVSWPVSGGVTKLTSGTV